MAVDDDYIRNNPSDNVLKEAEKVDGAQIRETQSVDETGTGVVS